MQRRGPLLPAVLAVLMATGWAANHFAAVLPALRDQLGLSPTLVAGVYGLYAVGLLPGLLTGGALSDRVGRARVAVPGAVLAAVGTTILALWHTPVGLGAGRVVVGLGAGATFSAGTAWASDLAGAAGAARAGLLLSAGFAVGPVVSGLVATVAPAPLVLPFALSATASLIAVAAVARGRGGGRQVAGVGEGPDRASGGPRPGGAVAETGEAVQGPGRVDADAGTERAPGSGPAAGAHPAAQQRTVGHALSWALPIAPWVFVCTVGLVVVPRRMDLDLPGPLVAGLAAGIALGVGIAAQAVARRRDAGPATGTWGTMAVGAGLALMAVGGLRPGVALGGAAIVLLGLGYGLALRAGLLDIERHAPARRRGLATGVYYVATYLGFAAPVGLEALEPVAGAAWPPAALAALAVAVAAHRAVRLGVTGRVEPDPAG